MRVRSVTIRLHAISTVVALGIWGGDADARDSCPPEMAKFAEESTDRLESWGDVYGFYLALRQCDSGGVAEATDDKIVQLLATHWETLHELADQVQKHPQFLRYVLRHLNQLRTSEQFDYLMRQSKDACPTNARAVCNAITAKLRKVEPQRVGE